MADAQVVAIIGAGTMGRGIARSVIGSGRSAILVDRQSAVLTAAQTSIASSLARAVERGALELNAPQTILERLALSSDLRSAAPADIVIEAIPEDLALKRRVLVEIDACVRSDAVIATNTSAIRLDALASAMSHPARFLGMHYFYPAASNRLLEIVCGRQTSPDTLVRARAFAQSTGKVALACRDSNGFVVNRFFAAWLNEAVRLDDAGASRAAIECAGMASFGAPFGPFKLMALTKTEIALHALQQLSVLGAMYQPAPGLVRQVSTGQEWQVPEPAGAPDSALTERLRAAVWFAAGELLDAGVCTAGAIEVGAAVGLRWTLGPIAAFTADPNAAYRVVERIAREHTMAVPLSLRGLYAAGAATS